MFINAKKLKLSTHVGELVYVCKHNLSVIILPVLMYEYTSSPPPMLDIYVILVISLQVEQPATALEESSELYVL